MRQEERKIQAKRKIMDNALLEFATRGYSASSVNNIYDSEQGISKGLIYHYFKSKDELFLACVEECFEQLKEYIQNHIFIKTESSSLKECLTQYYKTRMIFFHENPLYQKIFCEAVIVSPAHLKSEITHRRKALENMNIQILEQFLSKISLRDQFQQSEVAKLFVQFLNFMDLQSRTTENHVLDLQEYEQRGQVIMDIFLFGVVKKEAI